MKKIVIKAFITSFIALKFIVRSRNSIMSDILGKSQTRGRPRKNYDQKLPPISRQLFSEHCAVFYACCMVYVLEVFLKTKQEKRIGHSEGGFTIYQKCSSVYCFDTLDEDLKHWGYGNIIIDHKGIYQFIRTANGSAPKFVFRQLVTLFMTIHEFLLLEKIQNLQQLQACQNQVLNQSQVDLNKTFKYIRFTTMALKQLKLQKWSTEVSKKIKDLWRPFIKIVTYTIFCIENNIEQNRYLKPFFSDAQHPEETIIGQLNLEQIVQQKQDKIMTPNLLGFTKISKNFQEELLERLKNTEFQKNFSLTQRAPLANRRPITLITFPSNTKIETNASPTKPISVQNLSNQKQDILDNDLDQIQLIYPTKKIKFE